MLKKFAPIAIALSLAAGALPVAAEVLPAGSPAVERFAERQLVGVYKMQPVYALGQTIEPGIMRVGYHPELGLLLAQNDKLLALTLQSVDTDHQSANFLDEAGGLVTFRASLGTASLTMASGTTFSMIHIRPLAPQDVDAIQHAMALAGAVAAPQQAPVAQPATAPAAAAQPRPSFDCAKASTAIEGMICGNAELADLDSRLAVAYRDLRQVADDPEREKRDQVAWVREVRNACKTVDCLLQTYTERVDDLEATAQYLSKPAAFR